MSIIALVRHGTCLGVRPRLSALRDGELEARVEERVRRHLAACSRCSRAAARLEATIAAVARLRSLRAPVIESVRPVVAARIEAELASEVGNGEDR